MKTPDAQEVLALWQAAWPEQGPSLAGLEQRLGEAGGMRWRRDAAGRLTALALFRPPENHPYGHIRLVLVHPDWQRRGLGRELVAEVRAALPGLTLPPLTLALGEERGHFLPGCTVSSVPFWEACDFVASGRMPVDMACDLRSGLASARLPAHLRLTDAREDGIGAGVLDLTASVFSRRWTQDAQAVLDAAPWQVLALAEADRVVGFALTGLETDPRILPSVLYPQTLRRVTGASGLVGGLGPVGLHPDLRGAGLGRGLMLACMGRLRERGAEVMGIDWTGIASFYEKLGFVQSCQYIQMRSGG